jgi:hypothetical protein
MPVVDAAQALALLRRRGVLMQAAEVAGVTSLAAEIAGEPIRGSWWGHRAGKRIFDICEALHDSGEVLVTKLCAKKVTFVHRGLWAALYRVVTDPEWRAAQRPGLTPAARRLLDQVEEAGEVRLDRVSVGAVASGDRRAPAGARDELEQRMLVQSQQIHTEAGNHATVLRSWQRWASEAAPELPAETRSLERAQAEAAVRAACGEAALGTDPRPARRATKRRAP